MLEKGFIKNISRNTDERARGNKSEKHARVKTKYKISEKRMAILMSSRCS